MTSDFRRGRFVLSAIFTTVALVAGPVSAGAAPGDVDTGFGKGGTTISRVSPTDDAILRQTIALDDGSTISAGGVYVEPVYVDGEEVPDGGPAVLMKRQADGTLDPSFGTAGISQVPDGIWNRIEMLDDGRIVTFGRTGNEAAVGRFLPDGTPDPAFGTNGIATPEFRSQFSDSPDNGLQFIGAGLDTRGRPVAIGFAGGCATGTKGYRCPDEVMVRLLSDGRKDLSFGGGDGVAPLRTELDDVYLDPQLAVLAPDDSIVLGEAYYYPGDEESGPGSSVAIGRYEQDGTRMTSFGGTGLVSRSADKSNGMTLLTVDGDGRVTASTGPQVFRFRKNGGLDPAFGTRGTISLPRMRFAEISSSSIDSTAVGPDGRFYFGGIATVGRMDEEHHVSTSVVVVRLGPGGGLDPTFSGDGVSRAPLGESEVYDDYDGYGEVSRARWGTEPVFGPEGKVIVAAPTLVDDQARFTLTRFETGTPPIPKCHGVPATVVGTEGRDDLVAGDVTVTGGGWDRIRNASGLICSGDGDDTVTGKGTFDLYAGGGDDRIDALQNGGTIHGGAGNDEVTTEGAPVTVRGDAGNDRVIAVGASSNDTFFGGPGKDLLDASWGEDFVDGGPGPDRLIGSRAPDRLFGRAGRDFIAGGAGTDELYGGAGRDVLRPGPRGPKERHYRGRSDDGKLFLKFRGGKFVFGQMPVKTTCGDGDSYLMNEGSTFTYSEFKGKKGKFGYYENFTDDFEGDEYLDEMKGRLTRKKVTGRYRSTYKAWRGSDCWTGKGFRNAWVKFSATRVKDPAQIVIQGGR